MTEEDIKFIKWILAQENPDEGLAKMKSLIERFRFEKQQPSNTNERGKDK